MQWATIWQTEEIVILNNLQENPPVLVIFLEGNKGKDIFNKILYMNYPYFQCGSLQRAWEMDSGSPG